MRPRLYATPGRAAAAAALSADDDDMLRLLLSAAAAAEVSVVTHRRAGGTVLLSVVLGVMEFRWVPPRRRCVGDVGSQQLDAGGAVAVFRGTT